VLRLLDHRLLGPFAGADIQLREQAPGGHRGRQHFRERPTLLDDP
jgi:hypothetical protein